MCKDIFQSRIYSGYIVIENKIRAENKCESVVDIKKAYMPSIRYSTGLINAQRNHVTF